MAYFLSGAPIWGLWLVPLGILTYRSRFLPRFLGVWLIINGFAYVAVSVTGLLFPRYQTAVDNMAFPVLAGEVAFLLWLLSMGAKELPSGKDTFPTGKHAELLTSQ